MLALEPVIVERVRMGLSDLWTVKGMFSDAGKRDAALFASVLFVDADVTDSDIPGAMVRPQWAITLVARHSDAQAPVNLDDAFAGVVEVLQGWAPGLVAQRRWDRLQLVRVKPPPFLDNGLVGVELIFSTSARYDGQP